MATEKQIAANRRNALRSTGPRTAEGKARVAQNRRQHGLYSADPQLPDVQNPMFVHHLLSRAEEHPHLSAAQQRLLVSLALAWWEQEQANGAETDLYRRFDEEKASPEAGVRDQALRHFCLGLEALNRRAGHIQRMLWPLEDAWLVVLGCDPEALRKMAEEEADEDTLEDDDGAQVDEAARSASVQEVSARERFVREAIQTHFGVGAAPAPPGETIQSQT